MNVLITGAAGGLARKTISYIQNKNTNIYVTVHTEKQLELVQKKYENYDNIHCLKLDITNSNDREKLRNLKVDILVCNAAVGEGGSLTEMKVERIRNNFETNVFSNLEVIQIVLKSMIERNKGRIIIISSLAGILPIPFLGSYCSTKASLIQIGSILREEIKLLHKNIDIVLIEPGLYKTGFNQVMLENKYKFMEEKSYFKEELEQIRETENILTTFLEKKKLDSIAKKIAKAILSDSPKRVYRAPILQSIGAKIYTIFKL